nr:hypothetical protein [uncultured Draconibacterium sp.]
MNKFIFLSIITLLFVSCDSSKLDETPIEKFIGVWEIQGRTMFDGIEVSIEKNGSGSVVGKVVKLNDNKYVQMFLEENAVWVTGIKRSSNYQFKLTERKIASELFSLYGQKTSVEFEVQFINDNLFGLGTGNSDPIKSAITYKRKK